MITGSILGLLAGILIGSIAMRCYHRRRLHRINEALDRRDSAEELFRLPVLQEGEYGFLRDELKLLYDRTEHAVEALQQDKQNMKRYIEDISHELKTPLSALITYLELLYCRETRDYERGILHNGIYLAEKMDTLLRSLLDLARLETEDMVLHYEACDLAALVQETVEDVSLCTFQVEPKVEFINALDNPADGILYTDPYWMSHALQNILKNSIYYGGNPPCVKITLQATEELVELRIADHGQGIPKEKQEKIFERFYRAEPGERQGYGIGLALARMVVEQHGGNLFVVSEQGACFVMQLFRQELSRKHRED